MAIWLPKSCQLTGAFQRGAWEFWRPKAPPPPWERGGTCTDIYYFQNKYFIFSVVVDSYAKDHFYSLALHGFHLILIRLEGQVHPANIQLTSTSITWKENGINQKTSLRHGFVYGRIWDYLIDPWAYSKWSIQKLQLIKGLFEATTILHDEVHASV